jgi:hypothetical protein
MSQFQSALAAVWGVLGDDVAKEILSDIKKGLTANFLKKSGLWDSDSTEVTVTERVKIGYVRSYYMARFARQHHEKAGFWKVGNEHAKDIKLLEENVLYGGAQPYGLMNLVEFDQLMDERRQAQQGSSSASSSSSSSTSSLRPDKQ